MPSYRHTVHGTVVHLPDGHRVRLGSEWEELGNGPAPATARRRKRKTDTDED